ncbi:MAG: amidohydrolase family protein [Alphaproteobacteria bacterium]|nr:amidohydrolase family protein [Alphaproteobacteria bacterium]
MAGLVNGVHMRMILGFFLAAILAASLASCASTVDTDRPPGMVTRYEGGYVFDGRGFVARPLCMARDRIVRCAAQPIAPGGARARALVIELDGAFITPPFGDAHTHHFDGPATFDWHNALNLEAGVFYALNLTAPATGVSAIRRRLAAAATVDVASATGGITGPESHPAEIYEALAIGAYTYDQQLERQAEIRASRKMADNAYFVVSDEADLRAKWPLVLAAKPDLVKVFLRKSDRYREGYGKWGPGGGIDPVLMPTIVALAHAKGLRVAASTSNVADFRVAAAAGADIITHLPCYQDSAGDPDSPYYDVDLAKDCLLTDDDARAAGRADIVATLITSEWEKDRPTELVAWERANVARLREAGVRLVIGSNAYGGNVAAGLVAGVEKGMATATEMLRMSTMDTPRAIFPGRKVGCLNPGCEASFLAFSEDPTGDFGTIERIALRVKAGEALNLASDLAARD